MKPVGIRFPTPAEAALRDAEELRGLSAAERYRRFLSLLGAVEGICRDRPERARQLAELEHRKDEELRALVRVQVRGHV